MMLIDFSAISISNIVVQKVKVDEDLIRHMILNSIRTYVKRYSKKYGKNVVIACDSSSWRRDYFPQYKASRREKRKESSDDWNEIFRIINMVREEIEENMPYNVIKINGCEADDIIGTLTEYNVPNPTIIISADKDFIQLQKYPNVKQYSPTQKKDVTSDNPARYLLEHIFRGDSGDGVPNILSNDDCFINKERQSAITSKRLNNWIDNIDNIEEALSTTEFNNYCRNRKLIDLSQTPEEIKNEIIETYKSQSVSPKNKVLPYLISKKCKQLIECIEEFYP